MIPRKISITVNKFNVSASGDAKKDMYSLAFSVDDPNNPADLGIGITLTREEAMMLHRQMNEFFKKQSEI